MSRDHSTPSPIAKEQRMGYYTLDDAALAASAESDPQGLLASLPKPLVLDEFQMAPNLIGAIKMASDTANDGYAGRFFRAVDLCRLCQR